MANLTPEQLLMPRGEGGFTGIAPEPMAPPEMAFSMPDLSGMAQSLTQKPPKSGPPEQNMSPNIVNLFKNLAMAGHGNVVDGVPQRPATKSDAFQAFLGDFLSSFATGMGAAGTGPGANGRGFAAAMGAPRQQQLQDYALQQQAQQQDFGQQQQGALNESIIGERGTQSALNLAQAQRALTPAQDTTVTPFDAWRQQNPNAPIKDWIELNATKANPPQANELQQWLKDNPGKNTNDYLKFKSGLSQSGPDARMDRSYQYTTSQIQSDRKPVDERADRLNRLEVSLQENSPQADALIAPELLTAMAGGQGSGLRMNEAEISRIVGGRSNWETLKAKVNKWRIDPSKALSITPEQRGQIQSLVTKMREKVLSKQSILDEAQQGLINSKDVIEHRRILADTRKKLSFIDKGESSAIPPRPPGVPPEAVWNAEARQWQIK